MNYNPDTRNLANGKTKSLTDASPSSKSRLNMFDGRLYAVIGGTGFGENNSHENAAIYKLSGVLIDIES